MLHFKRGVSRVLVEGCNPLTVAAERAEAEVAGLSVEEWRETVKVWVSRKKRRHLGQAAGKRLVSGRLCEDMQVMPQGRRKHSFKHTSLGGTIGSDKYVSPAGPSRGDQRASCLLRIAGARHAALPQRAALAAVRRRRLLRRGLRRSRFFRGREREQALPSKLAVWVLVTSRTMCFVVVPQFSNLVVFKCKFSTRVRSVV